MPTHNDRPTTPTLPSRLPHIGTTIFSVMSALAQQHQAINLGQGFPDFDCDPALIEQVSQAMRTGGNQYPPMAGVASLRQAIADKTARLYQRRYDRDDEITVTAGATQAIFTAILCAVSLGDEVIVLEPAYDSYGPAIALAGGVPIYVPMSFNGERFSVPWDQVAAAVTPRTRMLIINSPHNPTGMTLQPDDLATLAEIVAGTSMVLLADEVYEHMVYDGAPHHSLCTHPQLADRAFVVSSFGKTFHVTGWKIGYCLAPAALTSEFRKVHQFNVFTVNTPMQQGIAEYLQDPTPFLQLSHFYQRKRDHFAAAMQASRFRLLPCAGTYFQLVDYSAISAFDDDAFCRWLIEEIGVAAIPLSALYQLPRSNGLVRLCFAKQTATLDAAAQRLARA